MPTASIPTDSALALLVAFKLSSIIMLLLFATVSFWNVSSVIFRSSSKHGASLDGSIYAATMVLPSIAPTLKTQRFHYYFSTELTDGPGISNRKK